MLEILTPKTPLVCPDTQRTAREEETVLMHTWPGECGVCTPSCACASQKTKGGLLLPLTLVPAGVDGLTADA